MSRRTSASQSKNKTKAAGRGNSVRAHHSVPESIRRVAALLCNNSGESKDNVRKHERQVVVMPCRVQVDSDGLGALRGHDGYVLNIAPGGVGMLIDEPRTRDDLIEIKIEIRGELTYLCGTVIFCRHIEGNVHEVGVQLQQRSDKPLLSHLAGSNDKDNPEWYLNARDKLRDSRGEKKKSA